MGLDVKTLYLINIFVALLSAAVSLMAWLDHRDIPGLRTWAIGLALGALGALASSLCPPDSPCVFAIAGDVLVVGGYATLWMGARQFNGAGSDVRYATVPVAVFLGLTVLTFLARDELQARGFIAAAMMTGLALLAAWEIFREREYASLYSGLPAGVAFAATATEKAFRAASFWAEGSPPLDLVQESRSEVMLCVNALCLLSIVFGLIMMANERVRRRLEELASTDPLTGLSNRRCFFEKASACCRRLADGRVPASILMMDLDKFSSVNKRFGHHGGDRALAAFAVLARDLLRSSDLIGRYGGEEFCVLLRDADAAEAGRIAERLRAGVAALSIDIAGRSLRFTVSIGLASLVDGDLEAAIHQADAALYRAKALGRDRVCGVSAPDVWTGDELPVAPLAAAALAPA